jgi:hypothetical protein
MKREHTTEADRKNDEGWTWLVNSPKWHYFRSGRSLCGRWLNLGRPELQQGDQASLDNCAACFRKRQKEVNPK